MALRELFPGVYEYEGELLTRNLTPVRRVYGEKLVIINGVEYRTWNPYKSKLASAIISGLKSLPLAEDSIVLYLGAATGTTASHISDICHKGMIYCIEFSPHAMQNLVDVCELRTNMVPLLRDARKPESYREVGEVDIIYQDVAQPDQVRILDMNARIFLKKKGYGMLCLKARSIDVSKPNKKIFEEAESALSERFEIVQKIDIERYEKDHMFYLLKLKP